MASTDGSDGNRALAFAERVVRFVALFGGGATLLGLVALTAADVALRYLFNAPIFGGHDYATILLVVTVAFSFGYSARTGGQVAVELFGAIASPQLTRWIDIATKSVGVAIIATLAYRLVRGGMNASDYGLTTSTLLISWEPYYYVLAFGMCLYVFVLLVEIVVLIRNPGLEL